jgi:pentatricopeptide repeat protein
MEEADALGEFQVKVGAIFKTWSPMLKAYQDYITLHSAVAEAYEKACSTNRKFKTLLTSITAQARREQQPPPPPSNRATSVRTVAPSGGSAAAATGLEGVSLGVQRTLLSFEDYLIMPIQRVPRYELLLSNLVRNTDAAEAGFESLKKAVDAVRKTAAHLNDSITRKHAQEQVLAVQKSIYVAPLPAESGSNAGGASGGGMAANGGSGSGGGTGTASGSGTGIPGITLASPTELQLVEPSRVYVGEADFLLSLRGIASGGSDCDIQGLRSVGLTPRLDALQGFINNSFGVTQGAVAYVPIHAILFNDLLLLTLPKGDRSAQQLASIGAMGPGPAEEALGAQAALSTPASAAGLGIQLNLSAQTPPFELFCGIKINPSVRLDVTTLPRRERGSRPPPTATSSSSVFPDIGSTPGLVLRIPCLRDDARSTADGTEDSRSASSASLGWTAAFHAIASPRVDVDKWRAALRKAEQVAAARIFAVGGSISTVADQNVARLSTAAREKETAAARPPSPSIHDLRAVADAVIRGSSPELDPADPANAFSPFQPGAGARGDRFRSESADTQARPSVSSIQTLDPGPSVSSRNLLGDSVSRDLQPIVEEEGDGRGASQQSKPANPSLTNVMSRMSHRRLGLQKSAASSRTITSAFSSFLGTNDASPGEDALNALFELSASSSTNPNEQTRGSSGLASNTQAAGGSSLLNGVGANGNKHVACNVMMKGYFEKQKPGILGGWDLRFFVFRVGNREDQPIAGSQGIDGTDGRAAQDAAADDEGSISDEESPNGQGMLSNGAGANGLLPRVERNQAFKGVLEYYREQAHFTAGQAPIGAVPLSTMTYASWLGAVAGSGKDRPRRIDIGTSSGRTYVLRASSEVDARQLARILTSALLVRDQATRDRADRKVLRASLQVTPLPPSAAPSDAIEPNAPSFQAQDADDAHKATVAASPDPPVEQPSRLSLPRARPVSVRVTEEPAPGGETSRLSHALVDKDAVSVAGSKKSKSSRRSTRSARLNAATNSQDTVGAATVAGASPKVKPASSAPMPLPPLELLESTEDHPVINILGSSAPRDVTDKASDLHATADTGVASIDKGAALDAASVTNKSASGRSAGERSLTSAGSWRPTAGSTLQAWKAGGLNHLARQPSTLQHDPSRGVVDRSAVGSASELIRSLREREARVTTSPNGSLKQKNGAMPSGKHEIDDDEEDGESTIPEEDEESSIDCDEEVEDEEVEDELIEVKPMAAAPRAVVNSHSLGSAALAALAAQVTMPMSVVPTTITLPTTLLQAHIVPKPATPKSQLSPPGSVVQPKPPVKPMPVAPVAAIAAAAAGVEDGDSSEEEDNDEDEGGPSDAETDDASSAQKFLMNDKCFLVPTAHGPQAISVVPLAPSAQAEADIFVALAKAGTAVANPNDIKGGLIAARREMQAVHRQAEMILASYARAGLALHALAFLQQWLLRSASVNSDPRIPPSSEVAGPTPFMHLAVVAAYAMSSQVVPGLEYARYALGIAKQVTSVTSMVSNRPNALTAGVRAVRLTALHLMASAGLLTDVRAMLARMSESEDITAFHHDCLVTAAFACRDWRKVETIVLDLLQRSIPLLPRTINTLIRSYANVGRVGCAKQIFEALLDGMALQWDTVSAPVWRSSSRGRTYFSAVNAWDSAVATWLNGEATAAGLSVPPARPRGSGIIPSAPSTAGSRRSIRVKDANNAPTDAPASILDARKVTKRCLAIGSKLRALRSTACIGANAASFVSMLAAHSTVADTSSTAALCRVLNAAIEAQTSAGALATLATQSGDVNLPEELMRPAAEDDSVDFVMHVLGMIPDANHRRLWVPDAVAKMHARAYAFAGQPMAAMTVAIESRSPDSTLAKNVPEKQTVDGAKKGKGLMLPLEVSDSLLLEVISAYGNAGKMDKALLLYEHILKSYGAAGAPGTVQPLDASRASHVHQVMAQAFAHAGCLDDADEIVEILQHWDLGAQFHVASAAKLLSGHQAKGIPVRPPSCLGNNYWLSAIELYSGAETAGAAKPGSRPQMLLSKRLFEICNRFGKARILPSETLLSLILAAKSLRPTPAETITMVDSLAAMERDLMQIMRGHASSVFDLVPSAASSFAKLPYPLPHLTGTAGCNYVLSCVAADQMQLAQSSLATCAAGGMDAERVNTALSIMGLVDPKTVLAQPQDPAYAAAAVDPRMWPNKAALAAAYSSVITALAARGFCSMADRLCLDMEDSVLSHTDEDGGLAPPILSSHGTKNTSQISAEIASTFESTYKSLMVMYGLQGRVSFAKSAFENVQRMRGIIKEQKARADSKKAVSNTPASPKLASLKIDSSALLMQSSRSASSFSRINDRVKSMRGTPAASILNNITATELGSMLFGDAGGSIKPLENVALQLEEETIFLALGTLGASPGFRQSVRLSSRIHAGVPQGRPSAMTRNAFPMRGRSGSNLTALAEDCEADEEDMFDAKNNRASLPMRLGVSRPKSQRLAPLPEDDEQEEEESEEAKQAAAQVRQEEVELITAAAEAAHALKNNRRSVRLGVVAAGATDKERTRAYNALVECFGQSGDVEMAEKLLVEMLRDSVKPNADTVIALLHVYASVGMGHRALDVCASVAQIMIQAGASIADIQGIFSSDQVVAAQLFALASEGCLDLVQKAWERYRMARPVRHSEQQTRKFSRSTVDMLAMYCSSLAVASMRGGLRGHGKIASRTLTPARALNKVLEALLEDVLGGDMDGPVESQLDAFEVALNSAALSGLALLLQSTGNSTATHEIATSMVDLYCSSKPAGLLLGDTPLIEQVVMDVGAQGPGSSIFKASVPAPLDSESFQSSLFLLSAGGLAFDMKKLVAHTAVAAVSSQLGQSKASSLKVPMDTATVISHSWYAANGAWGDHLATLASWRYLQRMQSTGHLLPNTQELASIAAADNVGAVPSTLVAEVLIPRNLKAEDPVGWGKAHELSRSLGDVRPLTLPDADYVTKDAVKLASIPSAQVPTYLSANLRAAYLCGAGRLRDALLEFLPGPALPSKDGMGGLPVTPADIASGNYRARYKPLPETLTLTLAACVADVTPDTGSRCGLSLPASSLRGLVFPTAGSSLIDETINIRTSEAFSLLIQRVLTAACSWGLRPRECDIAAVVEVQGVMGKVDLALEDIRRSRSCMQYAALLRGLSRSSGVTLQDAETVLSNMLNDGTERDVQIVQAVEALGHRLRINLHTIFGTEELLRAYLPAVAAEADSSDASRLGLLKQQDSSFAYTFAHRMPSLVESPTKAIGYSFARWRLLRLSEQIGIDTIPGGRAPRQLILTLLSALREKVIAMKEKPAEKPVSPRTPSKAPLSSPKNARVALAVAPITPATASNASTGNDAAPQSSSLSASVPTPVSGFEVFDRPQRPKRTLPQAVSRGSSSDMVLIISPQSIQMAGTPAREDSSSAALAHPSIPSKENVAGGSNALSTPTLSSSSTALTSGLATLLQSPIHRAPQNVSFRDLLPEDRIDFVFEKYAISRVATPLEEFACLDNDGLYNPLPSTNVLALLDKDVWVMSVLTTSASMFDTRSGRASKYDLSLMSGKALRLVAGALLAASPRNILDFKMNNDGHRTQQSGKTTAFARTATALEDAIDRLHSETVRLEFDLLTSIAETYKTEAELNRVLASDDDIACVYRAIAGADAKGNARRMQSSTAVHLLEAQGGLSEALRTVDTDPKQEHGQVAAPEPSILSLIQGTVRRNLTDAGISGIVSMSLQQQQQPSIALVPSSQVAHHRRIHAPLPLPALSFMRDRRTAALRNVIEFLKDEESVLMRRLEEEEVNASLYANFAAAVRKIASAEHALVGKIAHDEAETEAAEDAADATLRSEAVGSGYMPSNTGSSGALIPAGMSSGLLNLAGRSLRRSRDESRMDIEAQLARFSSTVSALETMAMQQKVANSALRAMLTTSEQEYWALFDEVEAMLPDEEALHMEVGRTKVKMELLKREHSEKALEFEGVMQAMRHAVSAELERWIGRSDIGPDFDFFALAVERGQTRAREEGQRKLDDIYALYKMREESEIAEYHRASGLEAQATAMEEAKQKRALEDMLEKQTIAAARTASLKEELHARLLAEEDVLKQLELKNASLLMAADSRRVKTLAMSERYVAAEHFLTELEQDMSQFSAVAGSEQPVSSNAISWKAADMPPIPVPDPLVNEIWDLFEGLDASSAELVDFFYPLMEQGLPAADARDVEIQKSLRMIQHSNEENDNSDPLLDYSKHSFALGLGKHLTLDDAESTAASITEADGPAAFANAVVMQHNLVNLFSAELVLLTSSASAKQQQQPKEQHTDSPNINITRSDFSLRSRILESEGDNTAPSGLVREGPASGFRGNAKALIARSVAIHGDHVLDAGMVENAQPSFFSPQSLATHASRVGTGVPALGSAPRAPVVDALIRMDELLSDSNRDPQTRFSAGHVQSPAASRSTLMEPTEAWLQRQKQARDDRAGHQRSPRIQRSSASPERNRDVSAFPPNKVSSMKFSKSLQASIASRAVAKSPASSRTSQPSAAEVIASPGGTRAVRSPTAQASHSFDSSRVSSSMGTVLDASPAGPHVRQYLSHAGIV